MIAYRIQHEPNNRLMRQMAQTQQYGPVKLIESVNGQNQGDPNQWRQRKALAGGGALPDVGLYCLNTTRFLTGEEPTEVSASLYSTLGDPRFREVEETVMWRMRFPSGVQSNNATSYGFHEDRRYRVHATTGWSGLDPAFSYSGLRPEVSYAQGKAECIMQDKTPWTPGEEGLQDQRIMEAIYESARTGKPVTLPHYGKPYAFRGSEPAGEG